MGLRFSNLKGVIQETNFKTMDKESADGNNADSTKQDYQVSVLLDLNGNDECILSSNGEQPSVGSNLSNIANKETDVGVADVTHSEDNSNTCKCSVNSIKFESVLGNDDKTTKPKSSKKRSHKLFFPIKDSNIKKKNHWVLRFSCSRLKGGNFGSRNQPSTSNATINTQNSCVCTSYKKTDLYNPSAADEDDMSLVPLLQQDDDEEDDDDEDDYNESGEYSEFGNAVNNDAATSTGENNAEPVIDLSKFNPDDYPIEDCDERARLERAREIAEGVEPPPGFNANHRIELVCPTDLSIDNLTALFRSALSLSTLSQIDTPRPVHTQIDYIHCLVPDLLQITSCSFYWGKIDRYEAERLLDNKPEGTFLLRDSAQEEYLFSVSFRKYGRSLHARIEQWNHRFSFDSHDPGVFASSTVCGLIEHYKDPTCCMFFEPMLTIPLHRSYPFCLQHLCRAVICNHVTYDSINVLKLPKALKSYLKEYHYKQRVRVRKFEADP